MKQKIIIDDVIIGEGIPKICAPLTGETVEELLEESKLIYDSQADLAEWRVDFYQDALDVEKVKNTLAMIKEALQGKALIFTFRTAEEGGEKEISMEEYLSLNQAAAESGFANLIDIELFRGEDIVKKLVKIAKANSVYTIVSNHDFEKTPPKHELIARMKQALALGADLPKIAVMPVDEADVLTLLGATIEMKQDDKDRPIITMAMGGTGVISRLSGEIFGSALTFGAAKRTSAPGQISIDKLKEFLLLMHDAL